MNSFDYRENLIVPLVNHTQENMDMLLIESATDGDRPEEPFITYTITSPYIRVTFEDDLEDAPFECVLSLTIHHDKSSLDALNLAEKFRKSFVEKENLLKLKSANITVISASRSNTRDNLMSIDYERLAGFDLRVRLIDGFKDTSDTVIENIEI